MMIFLPYEKKFGGPYAYSFLLVFFVPFKIYKTVVWDTKSADNYLKFCLKIHTTGAGVENFSGMVVRFFENARLYLSKHFMIGIGLHDPTSTDKSWFVTLIVAVLFLVALYYAFRKKVMLFL